MAPFRWTLSWEYLRSQIKILSDLGFPEEKSLAALGFTSESNTPRATERISAEQALKVFEAAEQELGDPNIGLKVGYQFRVSQFGDTGRIFTQCENIRDVSVNNARYQPIAIDMAKIWFSEDKSSETGHQEYAHNYALYDHVSATDPNKFKHLIDLVFGAYGTAFRWLSWASAKELQGVRFQYDEPQDASVYQTVFNCPVQFGQPHNSVIFNEDVANARIATYDPVKRTQMIARLDNVLKLSQAAESFSEALLATIRQQISLGRLTKPLVIEAMGLSNGSFARSLKAAGTSYKDEVNRVRRRMIEDLLNTDQTFTEIAQAMGYSDQAAFNKAFDRLYGMTPSRYRDQQDDK